MSLKPITLWGPNSGPNAWKVAMILEELNVPYTHKIIEFPGHEEGTVRVNQPQRPCACN